MSKDLILKNAGRNWARGATDPDAVMKPTGKVAKPNSELMQPSKRLNKKAGSTNPEIMTPSFVKGAFVGSAARRHRALIQRTKDRRNAAIRARRNTIRGAEYAVPKLIKREYGHSMGDDGFVSDETRAQGEDDSNVGSSLSHNAYRATVMKQAIKDAGGKTPSTKHLFGAKKKVDEFLGKAGVSIFLPGARPGRRTI